MHGAEPTQLPQQGEKLGLIEPEQRAVGEPGERHSFAGLPFCCSPSSVHRQGAPVASGKRRVTSIVHQFAAVLLLCAVPAASPFALPAGASSPGGLVRRPTMRRVCAGYQSCFQSTTTTSFARPPARRSVCAHVGAHVTLRAEPPTASGRGVLVGLARRWTNGWRTRGVTTNGRAVPSGETLADVSGALGCEPPLSAPKWVWKMAWEVFKAALPLLHLFDRCKPGDTFLNLSVAWWKAMAGNRRGAVTADGGLAWDMLPPLTRWVLAYPLCLLFPRLHHQNVALRTAYLDSACRAEMKWAAEKGKAVRLVSLGAGFDTRSFKLATIPVNPSDLAPAGVASGGFGATPPLRAGAVAALLDSYELDLPDVVAQKRRVIEER
jgi:hypothetical protein